LQRSKRYQQNNKIIVNGMLNEFGFELYLKPQYCSHIITSFQFHKSKNWNFDQFYSKIAEKGFVIYTGKVRLANTFRVGNIGHIFQNDCYRFLDVCKNVCKEMKL